MHCKSKAMNASTTEAAAALAEIHDDDHLNQQLKALHLEHKEKEADVAHHHPRMEDDEMVMPEERWNPQWQPNLKLLQEVYPQIPEHELRNFLIYVHGDTKKARERLAACVAWRQMHLPIRKEEIQQPLKQGLFFFHGQDVAGRPVGYFRLLNHDRKKRSIEEHVKAVVYQSERLKERMGTSEYRVLLLIDRRGANIFNQDIELYKAFFKTFADLYPMKLYRVILYPATTVTRVLWSMLRPFVHVHVQRRLVLLSSPEEIQRYVPKEQLLTDFGGDDDFDFRQDL